MANRNLHTVVLLHLFHVAARAGKSPVRRPPAPSDGAAAGRPGLVSPPTVDSLAQALGVTPGEVRSALVTLERLGWADAGRIRLTLAGLAVGAALRAAGSADGRGTAGLGQPASRPSWPAAA